MPNQKTCKQAISDFLANYVNLDSANTKIARSSRDNLKDNISSFSGNDDFFEIFEEKNLDYGSFARKVKIRPIDDIDIMICLSTEERTYYYNAMADQYKIHCNLKDETNGIDDGNGYLNSTKVINRFISKLAQLNDYRKAELHKNKEAATVQLKSYTWNFDIVPCFYIDSEFYLIPDGNGNWKKADPRIDSRRLTELDLKFGGNLLQLVRLVKYWNRQKHTLAIPSYMLETMILDIYETKQFFSKWDILLEFAYVMDALSRNIMKEVFDYKNIQGDLNKFDIMDKFKISNAMKIAYQKAHAACTQDDEDAIAYWKDIFGDDFSKCC